MPNHIELYAFLVALAGYLLLSLLLVTSYRGKPKSRILILTVMVTAVWAAMVAATEGFQLDTRIPESIAEYIRNIVWLFFLYSLVTEEPTPGASEKLRVSRLWVAISLAGLLLIAVTSSLMESAQLSDNIISLVKELHFAAWLGVSIIALMLTEELIRNSSMEQRWAIKYLCLGAGAIFAFDFYIYANALLFRNMDPLLQSARAVVIIFAIPMLAITAARSNSLQTGIHISRHVVFHSVTLMGSGIYLIVMAAAGYYIRYFGGVWGNFLQIVFLVGAGLFLLTLLFSDKIRMRLRVFLSKHFFSYKYDYRQEWIKFTDNLANTGGVVPDRSCQAIATLVNSPGGLLWIKNYSGDFELSSHWNTPEPEIPEDQMKSDLKDLVRYLQRTFWVIDIKEYTEYPQRYEELVLPPWISETAGAWLIVPLILNDDILGIILLRKSSLTEDINWEDRDLLKMAGQQAAIHIAQYRSDQALIHARQFEAFNRLSAYVMHDLKNILAQQSLIIANAEKHKNNPRFIDDMILTVKNSVDRMTRLMEQMKQGSRSSGMATLPLNRLLTEIVQQNTSLRPKPTLSLPPEELLVSADREQLANVFNHMIQNAQEATPDDGSVTIELSSRDHYCIVTIQDTGTGMPPSFVRERLFKPFDTTKGLTGMGIGAFESRNYIQSVGGDISVESEVDKGSLFRISLPCQRNKDTPREGNRADSLLNSTT